MTFLPIVDRELRVRSRSLWTHRFRVLAALAASLFTGFLLLGSGLLSNPGALGKGIFLTLAWAALLYALLEGARNTADCLSAEKRAGTLGLLFLTDLKGYDVVLGKVVATSLNSVYGLLAIFPPLGVPLVMGGVTAGEFWRLTLVLLGALAFSLSAGVFMSACSREARSAWLGTVLIVAGCTLLPLGLGVPAGPGHAFASLFDQAYRAVPGDYWTGVGGLGLASLGLVAAASLVLPRAWQEGTRKVRDGDRGRRRPAVVAQGDWRETHPVAWLVAGGARPRFGPWALVLGLGLLGLWLWSRFPGANGIWIGLLWMLLLLHVGLSIWVASEACALLAGARDSGLLEQLFGTPLSVPELLAEFRLGLRRTFLRPLLLLLGLEGVLLAGGLLGVGRPAGVLRLDSGWVLLWAALSVGTAVMDTFAVASFGMWAGLSSGRHSVALGKTLGWVLLGPLFLGVFCQPLWILLDVVKNLIVMAYAEDQLRRRSRSLVLERYVGEPVARVSPPGEAS